VDVLVDIVDAIPTVSVSGNLTAVSGNASAATCTLSYAFGADGAGSLTVNGSPYTVPTEGTPTKITGTHGVLTIHADGTYSYTADANTGGQRESFEFVITDADGDDANATLHVTISAASGPNPSDVGAVEVHEAGLVDDADDSE